MFSRIEHITNKNVTNITYLFELIFFNPHS